MLTPYLQLEETVGTDILKKRIEECFLKTLPPPYPPPLPPSPTPEKLLEERGTRSKNVPGQEWGYIQDSLWIKAMHFNQMQCDKHSKRLTEYLYSNHLSLAFQNYRDWKAKHTISNLPCS